MSDRLVFRVLILSKLPLLCADDRRMMALMMLTGMRRGEALGLRWEDIDLSVGLIHIQRNVTYAQNQPFIGTPKTAKGERDVPINNMLLSHLEPIQKEGFYHWRYRTYLTHVISQAYGTHRGYY